MQSLAGRLFQFAIVLFGCLAVAHCSTTSPAAGTSAKSGNVLIFSHTTGFRHKSVEVGVASMANLVRSKGMVPTLSDDPAILGEPSLDRFQAIIFVNSTTKKDDPASEWLVGPVGDNFKRWLSQGGAVVGLHAASDSHHFQPWFGQMMGGRFKSHPRGVLAGKLTVMNARHPATKTLPTTFDHPDEWYEFYGFDPAVTLLVTLDPTSIGQPAGAAWPVSWSRRYGGGRIFFTSMGHAPETYTAPVFLDHVSGGLDWALGSR